jgi:hypothetical protein
MREVSPHSNIDLERKDPDRLSLLDLGVMFFTNASPTLAQSMFLILTGAGQSSSSVYEIIGGKVGGQ